MKYPLPRCLPLILAASAVLLGGCDSESAPSGSGSFPQKPLETVVTDSGLYTIDVRTSPDQPPSRGLTDVKLTIADKEGNERDDLAVSAVPWMPDMGHGASTKPSVVLRGKGAYDVMGVNMFMPGQWELRIEIGGSAGDSAKAIFDIP